MKSSRIAILASIMALAGLALMFVVGTKAKNVIIPVTDEDYARVSVSIETKGQRSGGSGVILRSTANESWILTNKHVCSLVKSGGKVIREDASFEIQELKPYPKHDLCLIKTFHSFGVNVKVAQKAPALYSGSVVPGHPGLLPTVVNRGHFSGRETIQVMVDIRPCTEKDAQENLFFCMFLGGIPVMRSYETQVVTNLILPGSSGSPVFNAEGELSGMVFASRSRELSYAYIVPFEYVYDFLRTQASFKWIKTTEGSKKGDLFRSVNVNHDVCYSLNRLTRGAACSGVFNPYYGVK